MRSARSQVIIVLLSITKINNTMFGLRGSYMYVPITRYQCMGHVLALLKYNDLKVRCGALGLLINREAYIYIHDGTFHLASVPL